MKLEIQLFLFSLLCILNTSADKAIPLITVKPENGEKQFILNPEALSMIRQLSSPVKVIAAIGDKRAGKSTALNNIHHAFGTENAKDIFQTGNTMEPVTHGVWISIINGEHGMDDVILLDVEGTDLGDDRVTDKLSIFATLMSSSLMLFMKEHPTNHITDFLYKIVRISEIAFPKEDNKYFPQLIVVLRGALKTPQGYTNIDDYVKDSLTKPASDDNWKSSEKKKVIKRRFEEAISVIDLPLDTTASNHRYRDETISSLAKQVWESPTKKISEESVPGYWPQLKVKAGKYLQIQTPDEAVVIDGQTLGDLAEKLVKVMNHNLRWIELEAEFYNLAIEKDACKQSWDEFIKPLLNTGPITPEQFEKKMKKAMYLFDERCPMKGKSENAENILLSVLKQMKSRDLLELIADAFFWIYENPWKIIVSVITLVVAKLVFLSDIKLKENITVVKNSEFQTIGLRGVEWVWNKQAERLGLSGRGSGVVAQEVELLYPWAVTEGHDGYKRVNYLALRLLILGKKFMNFTLHDEYSRFFANDDLVKKEQLLRDSFHKAINV